MPVQMTRKADDGTLAIYGDFEYHTFSDIIKVLQRHTGVLFMRTALSGRSVELHLQRGTLHAVFIDGFPVHEPLRVRDTIRSLVTSANGEYSFDAGDISHYFALPIRDIIREVMSTADIPEQQLPHEETRFEVQEGAAHQTVPESLRASWGSIAPVLKNGASAIDVSSQLRISLQEARVTLYRLRTAGLIAPKRAAGIPSFLGGQQSSTASEASPQKSGPVRRLLSALRRLVGGTA